MLAVFVFWGLMTEGIAEHPAFAWFFTEGAIEKRVGLFLNFITMKKLSFEKFAAQKIEVDQTKKTKGGGYTCATSGDDYNDGKYTWLQGGYYYDNSDCVIKQWGPGSPGFIFMA
jgi:hypothetical protein